MDEEHRHEGSFATGVEKTEHHPEREEKGHFAEGEEEGEHVHEGSFASGVETAEHHPEREHGGGFAEGEEGRA